MIKRSGTFEYEAEFTSDSFRESDLVVQGTLLKTMDRNRLVGPSPMIRFWNDRLVLVASEQANASVRNTSFRIGNAVQLAASPGDRLYVVRTGRGGIGLSLLRDKQLILAIGAVTSVPLGNGVKVTEGFEGNDGVFRARNTWLEFQIGNEQFKLSDRTVMDVGNYQIYLESCWEYGIPGIDECVSVSVANVPAVNLASMRSAILSRHGDLKLTRWD